MGGQCTGERLTVGMESIRQIGGRGRSEGLLDLGNHVATANDEDLVADADAEAFHLTHVVEGGVLNGHATHALRRNASHGRDVPGPSGLPFNVQQHREGFLGRELPSQGPPRVVGRHPQAFSLFEVVKFEHHAVNFVGVTAPFLRPSGRSGVEERSRFGRRGRRMDFPRCGNDAEGVLQPHQHVRVVGHVGNSNAVRMAMFARRNLRIVRLEDEVGGVGFAVSVLLSESACCQVSRVG